MEVTKWFVFKYGTKMMRKRSFVVISIGIFNLFWEIVAPFSSFLFLPALFFSRSELRSLTRLKLSIWWIERGFRFSPFDSSAQNALLLLELGLKMLFLFLKVDSLLNNHIFLFFYVDLLLLKNLNLLFLDCKLLLCLF